LRIAQPLTTPGPNLPITTKEAAQNINAHLLRVCALLANDEPGEALKEADFTLYLAEVREMHHLESKSQFYRGLCLMELERWDEASKAFTRGASVRWWGWRVEGLKREAEWRSVEERSGRFRRGARKRLERLVDGEAMSCEDW
jgi:hypothetical protein